jgi:spore coat polysaccharide biosynthesis protein SpsF (cytidylyltransferase family)
VTKMLSENDIKKWVKKHYYSPIPAPIHPAWKKNLFKLSHEEIIEYLIERMRITVDETEYYQCMLFLYQAVPDSELFIPFPIDRYFDEGMYEYSPAENDPRFAPICVDLRRFAPIKEDFIAPYVPKLKMEVI